MTRTRKEIEAQIEDLHAEICDIQLDMEALETEAERILANIDCLENELAERPELENDN